MCATVYIFLKCHRNFSKFNIIKSRKNRTAKITFVKKVTSRHHLKSFEMTIDSCLLLPLQQLIYESNDTVSFSFGGHCFQIYVCDLRTISLKSVADSSDGRAGDCKSKGPRFKPR